MYREKGEILRSRIEMTVAFKIEMNYLELVALVTLTLSLKLKGKWQIALYLAFAGLAIVISIPTELNSTFFGRHNDGLIRHLIPDPSYFLEHNFLYVLYL